MRKLLVAALLVIFALATGLFVFPTLSDSLARKRLRARVSELAGSGVPTDNKSLDVYYKSATSSKFTDRWVELGDQFEKRGFHYLLADLTDADGGNSNDSSVVPEPGTAWKSRVAVDQFLRDWDSEWQTLKMLAEYEHMSDKPVYRPCEFRSTETLVPEVQNVQWFRGLLRLKHKVAVYDGDSLTTFAAIRVCQTLEHSLAAEPYIIGQIVRTAVGQTACEMITDSLRYDQLNESQLDEIEVGLEHFGPIPEMFHLAMIGERAMLLPVFSDPTLAAKAKGLLDSVDRVDLWGRGVDGLYFLDKMQTAIDLATDDVSTLKRCADDIEAMIQNASRDRGRSFEQKRRFSMSLLPPFQSYAEILVTYSDEIELTKHAIAESRRRESMQRPK